MNAEDKEQLRHAIREALNARAGVALPARGIRRRVEIELAFKITDDDVNAELEFLRTLTPPQVMYQFDEVGSTKWWQITAAGTLAQERRA
jgi:hypothetical protein